jgi:hypothetical protein
LNACSSDISQQNQLITGRITNNSEYKGGANPTQEILDALVVYKPSSNQHFYIRNASGYAPFTSIIDSFTTDNNGNYTISLPVGTYGIFGQEKYEFEQNPLADASCEYLQTPDFTLTVVANQQVYVSQYTDKLNICLPPPQ